MRPPSPSSAQAIKIDGQCFQVEAKEALDTQWQKERAAKAEEEKLNEGKVAAVLELLREQRAEIGKLQKIQMSWSFPISALFSCSSSSTAATLPSLSFYSSAFAALSSCHWALSSCSCLSIAPRGFGGLPLTSELGVGGVPTLIIQPQQGEISQCQKLSSSGILKYTSDEAHAAQSLSAAPLKLGQATFIVRNPAGWPSECLSVSLTLSVSLSVSLSPHPPF